MHEAAFLPQPWIRTHLRMPDPSGKPREPHTVPPATSRYWTSRSRPSDNPGIAEILINSDIPAPVDMFNEDKTSSNYFPRLLAFGFMITNDKLESWADAHNALPNAHPETRQSWAWENMNNMPWGWPTIVPVLDDDRITRLCFFIGSNQDEKGLEASQDIKRIYDYYIWLGRDVRPGWYPFDQDMM